MKKLLLGLLIISLSLCGCLLICYGLGWLSIWIFPDSLLFDKEDILLSGLATIAMILFITVIVVFSYILGDVLIKCFKKDENTTN